MIEERFLVGDLYVLGRLGCGTNDLGDIVNDVKVVVNHASTALETLGGAENLRSP